MNNLNSILVEGNLVRDPMSRQTQRGTQITTFCIASSRYWRGEGGLEKEVSFFEVEAWAKLAESVARIGRKGRGVRIVGRLRQDRWNDPQGKPRSRIVIVAEHVEFRPDFAKKAEDGEHGEYPDGQEVPPDDEIADESA